MKVILVILDGFGLKNRSKTVNKNNCPFIFKLMKKFFYLPLRASGKYVGLLKNNMGNSEVGHQTIGCGRIIEQPSVYITEEALVNFFTSYIIKEERVALIGMASNGNIHSSINHIIYLHRILKRKNKNITFHMISDGRDTKRREVKNFIKILQQENISISSISGRYYAMDRDNNDDRIKKYCKMIENFTSKNIIIDDVIKKFYNENITDEIFPPTLLRKNDNLTKDTFLIFTNFRADRMIQLFTALQKYNSITMVPYSNNKNCIFPQKKIKTTLGSLLKRNNISDCRIAESEKKNHITYFLNGNRSNPYKNQKTVIVKSNKTVIPAMKIDDIYKSIKDNIDKYNFITCNIANGDMVGHLGIPSESLKAVKIIDKYIRKIYELSKEKGVLLIITSDHGNVEVPDEKTHTTNKVPFIICSKKYKKSLIKNLSLKNILPTICTFLNIETKLKTKSLIKKF